MVKTNFSLSSLFLNKYTEKVKEIINTVVVYESKRTIKIY